VKLAAVAAAALGGMHGLVCMGEQQLGFRAMLRKRRQPQAARNLHNRRFRPLAQDARSSNGGHQFGSQGLEFGSGLPLR